MGRDFLLRAVRAETGPRRGAGGARARSFRHAAKKTWRTTGEKMGGTEKQVSPSEKRSEKVSNFPRRLKSLTHGNPSQEPARGRMGQ